MSYFALIALIAVGLVTVALSSLFYALAMLVRGAAWCVRQLGRLLLRRSKVADDPDLPDCPGSGPIVVAIHGTFAPRAPWAQPGSPLCQVIAGMTGGTWTWHCINWSGANTVAARLDTIRRLNALLTRVFAAHPERTVCLIGHSHGGNIALKSAQAFADRPGLRLVTLATPFLVAQHRPLAGLFATALPFVDVSILALLAGMIGVVAFSSWPAGLAVAVLLMVLGVIRQPRVAQEAGQDAADLYASTPDLATLDLLRPRTLVISRGGDEADGGLKLVSLLNGSITRSLRQSWLFDAVRAAQRLGTEHGLPEVRLGEALPPVSVDPKSLVRPALRAAGPLLWKSFRNREQVVAELVAFWFGLRLLQVLQPLVGTRTTTVAMSIAVTSSETPPGEWRHLQTLASTGDEGALLSHSQIYDDPGVPREIATFMATPSTAVAQPAAEA